MIYYRKTRARRRPGLFRSHRRLINSGEKIIFSAEAKLMKCSRKRQARRGMKSEGFKIRGFKMAPSETSRGQLRGTKHRTTYFLVRSHS
jgi:hypothetical protein